MNQTAYNPDLRGTRFPGHPGGQALLSLARGHERPDLLFYSHHLGCDHQAIARRAASLGLALPPSDPFYEEINEIVTDIKARHHWHERIFEMYCLVITLALPIAWAGFAIWGSLLAALGFGGLLLSYAFVIFHTRHHRGGKVFSYRPLDRLLRRFYDVIDATFMVEPNAWREQHQASHHVFANDPEKDYDVYHPVPWLRLHEQQPLKKWHRFQTFYVPLLLLLNAFSFPFTNVARRGGNPGYAFLYLLLSIIVPMLFNGFTGLMLFLIAMAPVSLLISYLFQVSHNFSDHKPVPENSVATFEQWVSVQIGNSTDYGGYLMTLLCGGINLQASHHVAPALSPALLYFLSPRLQKVLETRGTHFFRQRHLLEALISYHQRLHQLSR